MKILFKYATRSRPSLFHRGIESIINNMSNDNFHILVSVDKDDSSSNYLTIYKNTTIKKGTSLNKVDAINRDLQNYYYDWDILVNMSDDMMFTRKDFDKIIRDSFCDKNYLDQCIHFPDGNRLDLITMAIMGREYYKRFGYIYNPEYKSLYCDNEMTDVAKILNRYKFINDNLFIHLHPAYGRANFDSQYNYTESFNSEDQQTYFKRKINNYDL